MTQHKSFVVTVSQANTFKTVNFANHSKMNRL